MQHIFLNLIGKEPLIDLVTWVFEGGTFVPSTRITDKGSQSIVTDYLGTPTQMYDAGGKKTWEAQLDIYGRVRTFAESSLSECPFRYQGQYHDSETGLYYNRFRYYIPDEGVYISQDPIGLSGNNPTIYGYVEDTNGIVDIFGLAKHYTIPRQIYNPRTTTRMDGTTHRAEPLVSTTIANDPSVKGTRGNPNMWNIPDNVHSSIHNPNSDISIANGGDYNSVFAARVAEIGENITAGDVVKIRDQMAKDFDIEEYNPNKKGLECT